MKNILKIFYFSICDIFFIISYFFPYLFEIIFQNQNEISIEEYFFVFFTFTFLCSVFYIFISKYIYNQISTSFILKNTILIICIIFFILSVLYIFSNNYIYKKYINYYFGICNFLFILFYILYLGLIYLSYYILKQRNKIIFRKIANFDDEIEYLYKFISKFQKHYFHLYQYQKFMKYTNSYIIEKNNEILCSISLLELQNYFIIFDIYYYNIHDLNFMFSYLFKNLIKKNNIIILILNNSEESLYLDLLTENNINFYHNNSNISKNNNILFDLEKIKEKEELYILKNFYNKLLLDIKNNNFITLLKNDLQ